MFTCVGAGPRWPDKAGWRADSEFDLQTGWWGATPPWRNPGCSRAAGPGAARTGRTHTELWDDFLQRWTEMGHLCNREICFSDGLYKIGFLLVSLFILDSVITENSFNDTVVVEFTAPLWWLLISLTVLRVWTPLNKDCPMHTHTHARSLRLYSTVVVGTMSAED